MSGKGDTRRPAHIDRDTEAQNWARTFGAAPVRPLGGYKRFVVGEAPVYVCEDGIQVPLKRYASAPLDPHMARLAGIPEHEIQARGLAGW